MDYLSEEYGDSSKNILITAGATCANFLMTLYFKEIIEKFLIEKPAYQPLYLTPKSFDVEIERIDRRSVRNYSIDKEELKKKLEQPALVVLTVILVFSHMLFVTLLNEKEKLKVVKRF